MKMQARGLILAETYVGTWLQRFRANLVTNLNSMVLFTDKILNLNGMVLPGYS